MFDPYSVFFCIFFGNNENKCIFATLLIQKTIFNLNLYNMKTIKTNNTNSLTNYLKIALLGAASFACGVALFAALLNIALKVLHLILSVEL